MSDLIVNPYGFSGLAYADEVLADSPLFYFRLDEATSGSGPVDEVGTYTGAYQASPSKSSVLPFTGAGGFDFNGTSQYILVTTLDSAIDGQLNATYEAWVYNTGDEVILLDTRGSSSGHLFMINTSDQYQLTGYSTSFGFTTTATCPRNAWHHVACTIDGSGNWVVYRDGSSVESGTNATAPNPGGSKACIMARGGSGGSGFANYSGGKIAEVAYYGSALSASRILDHYQAAP